MDSVPSFLYMPIDAETRNLSFELEQLGGGDASSVPFEVHVICDDRLENKRDAQVVWLNHGSTVGIRDPSQALDAPAAENMKYYTLSSCHRLDDVLRRPSTNFHLINDFANWVSRGFNACLIGYGERLAGKTASLFGFDGQLDELLSEMNPSSAAPPSHSFTKGLLDSGGIAVNILRELYTHAVGADSSAKGEATVKTTTTIALSAWSLSGSRIIDLLAPSSSSIDGDSIGSMDFACVHCPTFVTALRILQTARKRAFGCYTFDASSDAATTAKYSSSVKVQEKHRNHFFLRILVHRQEETVAQDQAHHLHNPQNLRHSTSSSSTLSHVTLVDLIGNEGMEDDPMWRHLAEEDKIARRDHMIHLQSLIKIMTEMKEISGHMGDRELSSHILAERSRSSQMKITSARESKLTCMLAPLIQGNCRTVVLAFVKDGERHYKHTRRTLSAWEGVPRLLSGCHRIKGVSLTSLRLHHSQTVLSISASTSSSTQLPRPLLSGERETTMATHAQVLSAGLHQLAATVGGGGLMQGPGQGLGQGQGEEDVYQFVSGRSSELSKLMGEFDSLMTQLQNTQGQGPGMPSKQQSVHSTTYVGGSHTNRDPAPSRSIPSKVATASGPGPNVVSTLSHPSTSHRSSAASASATHFGVYDDKSSMYPLPSVNVTTTTTNKKLPQSTSSYPYPRDAESLSPGTDDAGPSPNVSMQDLQLIDTLKALSDLQSKATSADEVAALQEEITSQVLRMYSHGVQRQQEQQRAHDYYASSQSQPPPAPAPVSTKVATKSKSRQTETSTIAMATATKISSSSPSRRSSGVLAKTNASTRPYPSTHTHPPHREELTRMPHSTGSLSRTRPSPSPPQPQPSSRARRASSSPTARADAKQESKPFSAEDAKETSAYARGKFGLEIGITSPPPPPPPTSFRSSGDGSNSNSSPPRWMAMTDVQGWPDHHSEPEDKDDSDRDAKGEAKGGGWARDKEGGGEHKQSSHTHRHHSDIHNHRDGVSDRDSDKDRAKGEFSGYDRDTDRDDMNMWGEGGRAEEQELAAAAGRGGEEEAKGEGRGRMVAEPKSGYSRGSSGDGSSGGDTNYRGNDGSGSAKSMDEDAWRRGQRAGEEDNDDRDGEEEEDWASLKARVVRLSHTNRTLLQALQEEHTLRAASDERSKRLDQDLAESHTACEVDLEDHKLAVIRLKAQVRSLCSEQPLADIYAVFEDHVARLVAENQTLRQRNVALELKEDHGAWQTPQADQSFSSQRLAAQARKLNSFTVPPSIYGAGAGVGVRNDAEFDQGLGLGRDADEVSVDSLVDGIDGSPTSGGHAFSGRANTRAASRERQQHGKGQWRKGTTKSASSIGKDHAVGGDTSDGGWFKETGYLSREGRLGDGMEGWEGEEDAHMTVGAVSLMVDKSNKRAARLSAKLKRLAMEKEELRDRYEALCKRERQFVLCTKQVADASRRLNVSHQEVLRLRKELEAERLLRMQAVSDLDKVREDSQQLQSSEHSLRHERARSLQELSQLRERIRAMEEEKRQLQSLNRFVGKHAPIPDGQASVSASSSSSGITTQRHNTHTTSGGRGSGSSSPIPSRVHRQTQASSLAASKQYPFSLANHSSHNNEPPPPPSQLSASQSQQSQSTSYSNSAHSVRRKTTAVASSSSFSSSSSGARRDDHPSYSQKKREEQDRENDMDTSRSQGVQYVGVVMNGLAGNAEAPYIRCEETDVASPGLEAALTVMHDSIARINPTLLPVFRKLSNEIYVERTRMVQRHSQLIGQLSVVQLKGKGSTGNTGGAGGGSVQLMQHKRWLSPAMRDRSSPISTSPTFLTRARTHTTSTRSNSSNITTNISMHPSMLNNASTAGITGAVASSTTRDSIDLGSMSMANPNLAADLTSSQAYSGIFSDLAPSSSSSHQNNQSVHSYTQSYLQQQA